MVMSSVNKTNLLGFAMFFIILLYTVLIGDEILTPKVYFEISTWQGCLRSIVSIISYALACRYFVNIEFRELLAYSLEWIKSSKTPSQIQSIVESSLSLLGIVCWFLILAFRDNLALSALLFIFSVLLMSWSCIIFIGRSVFIATILSYRSTKFLYTSFSAIIIFIATSQTFTTINEITGVDASYFPLSITLGIFLMIVSKILIVSPYLFWGALGMFGMSLFDFKEKLFSVNVKLVILSLTATTLVFNYAYVYLRNEEYVNKILMNSITKLDMNSNNICNNKYIVSLDGDMSVTFLGNDARYILYFHNDAFHVSSCYK